MSVSAASEVPDELAAILTRGATTGIGWPADAETMIGLRRLLNIQRALQTVVRENVPGDFLEAGVWRGGACIFARAVLNRIDPGRKVWVCDSFQGLPESTHDEDVLSFHGVPALQVSLDEVKANFARYGVSAGVEFVPGWFRDTLPTLDVDLAVLRIDGDLYESTMDALALYGSVSPGGFVIVDDYKLDPCRRAVDHFRSSHHIRGALSRIDDSGVYWRKP